MRYQKGQGLIEFALVLPFLLIIIFGLFYAGMLFSDYIALNNIARVAAREASVVTSDDYKSSGFNTVYNQHTGAKDSLPNTLYTWNPSDRAAFTITNDKDSSGQPIVTVTLKASVNTDSGGLYVPLSNMFSVLQNMTVTYTMYSEYEHNDS